MMSDHLIRSFVDSRLGNFKGEIKKYESLHEDKDAGVLLIKLNKAEFIIPKSPVVIIIFIIGQGEAWIVTASNVKHIGDPYRYDDSVDWAEARFDVWCSAFSISLQILAVLKICEESFQHQVGNAIEDHSWNKYSKVHPLIIFIYEDILSLQYWRQPFVYWNFFFIHL